MKKTIFIFLFLLFLGGGILIWKRGIIIKARVQEIIQEQSLPSATIFVTSTKQKEIVDQNKIVEPKQTTSTDPFAWNGALPQEKRLAIPFLSQAPHKNWDMPYQEACEEAAMIMVNAYYQGKRADFTPDEGDRAILDLVEFEKERLGFYEDTTAKQTANIMTAAFGYDPVLVQEVYDMDTIKRALANGYPVMVPAAGKLLANPHFRNGGPLYHMLVIKGYTKEGKWITNDSGTQFGKDFLYTTENLQNAMHDWNDGNVVNGKPMMMVALPK